MNGFLLALLCLQVLLLWLNSVGLRQRIEELETDIELLEGDVEYLYSKERKLK